MSIELEKQAIERLRMFAPKDGQEPYYVCYSGGKDSDCIRILCELANVPYELWHNHTGLDAPETVYYVRSIPNINISMPDTTIWDLIRQKYIPPTRIMRYCCSELKERGGQGRKCVTGVRWAESVNRRKNSDVVLIRGSVKSLMSQADELDVDYIETSKGGITLNSDNADTRNLVDMCYRQHKTTINPIIDWTDSDVWTFLRHYGCESNPLYKEGYCRIGCIGCPMANYSKKCREFARYPKYKEQFIRVFDDIIKQRKEKGLKLYDWTCGEDLFKWWIGENPNQLTFDELIEEDI